MDYETTCQKIKDTEKKKLPQQEAAALCHLGRLSRCEPLEDVARYTGYRSCSICTWVNNGKLKHIPYGSSKIIPKEYLLDFLASKDGLNRKNKTAVFNDLINGFLTWKLQHRKWTYVNTLDIKS